MRSRAHETVIAERDLQAGYTIVAKESAPSSPWLVKGREDLATVYEALGRPDDARKYRLPTP